MPNPKLIAIILIVLILAFAFGFFPASILTGANKIACSSVGSDRWSCSAYGLGYVTGIGDNIVFEITKPSRGCERAGMVCSKVSSVSSQTCPDDLIECERYKINNNLAFAREVLGKQFIIVKGTDENNNPFETYGLCDVTARTCTVKDPFPGSTLKLTASSIIIYFREGGYSLDDACSEFNLNCPPEQPEIYYRFKDNICMQIQLLSSEITNNDYSILQDCEKNIIIVEDAEEESEEEIISDEELSFMDKLNKWIDDLIKRIFEWFKI